MANSLNGFIKLHRKLVAWGWYQDYVVKDVFLHLLLTANFRDNPWQSRVLKQGQLATSYRHLSESLGFSVQQIRTAIGKLKSTGEITTESTSKYTIITIVNWEDYQCSDDLPTGELTGTSTSEQQTNNKQSTSNQQQMNNDKNKRNKKEINKEKNSAAAPAPPLRADRLADEKPDLHKFKPDGTPLPKALIDAGITWAEYLEIKNQ
ncbi:MAG: hypothetical protein NC110_07600 [Ruminococcus sp.]|nr:hypothetical protein [Ruminococcus sp.]